MSNAAAAFGAQAGLAALLLPELPNAGDGSHDLAHLLRVWANIRAIRRAAGGDEVVLAAACLLHDCVVVEKNSPLRGRASRLAAVRAGELLAGLGWAPGPVAAVQHAVEAHSFSAGIAPETLEAKILQDADRLDAIGAMGIARCFYTAGRLGSLLYDPADPSGEHRALDDARFAMDHFRTKLLRLASGFQTEAGRHLAGIRHARLERFVADMTDEIGGTKEGER